MSSSGRSTLLTVVSPAPELVQTVTLFEDTWYGKIVPNRPIMQGRLEEVRATLAAPTYITASTSVPGRIVFVNANVRVGGTASLHIPVHPVGSVGTVTSAYFTHRPNAPIIWSPPGRGGTRR